MISISRYAKHSAMIFKARWEGPENRIFIKHFARFAENLCFFHQTKMESFRFQYHLMFSRALITNFGFKSFLRDLNASNFVKCTSVIFDRAYFPYHLSFSNCEICSTNILNLGSQLNTPVFYKTAQHVSSEAAAAKLSS